MYGYNIHDFMGRRVTRIEILAATASTAFLSHVGTGTMTGDPVSHGHEDEDGPTLHRFATSATGAEVTGLRNCYEKWA
jgi:uncharacterized protein